MGPFLSQGSGPPCFQAFRTWIFLPFKDLIFSLFQFTISEKYEITKTMEEINLEEFTPHLDLSPDSWQFTRGRHIDGVGIEGEPVICSEDAVHLKLDEEGKKLQITFPADSERLEGPDVYTFAFDTRVYCFRGVKKDMVDRPEYRSTSIVGIGSVTILDIKDNRRRRITGVGNPCETTYSEAIFHRFVLSKEHPVEVFREAQFPHMLFFRIRYNNDAVNPVKQYQEVDIFTTPE